MERKQNGNWEYINIPNIYCLEVLFITVITM